MLPAQSSTVHSMLQQWAVYKTFLALIHVTVQPANKFKSPAEISTDVTQIRPSTIYTFLSILTYSMVKSPSWEAKWFAAGQEIPRISRNPKVHYRHHKRPPPVSILGQPNPVHTPTSHLLQIRPNIIHPSTLKFPQWSPSLRFPHQDPTDPLSSTHTRHMPSPSHSSPFYHPHNIGWGIQIIYSPQHHILKHPRLHFLPQCEWPSFTPILNNRQNYSSIYLDL